MPRYLHTIFDWRTPEMAAIYYDISLWSAPFGLLLLQHLPLSDAERILDVGFGPGFPLIELAQRFGEETQVVGIDPWSAAVEIARRRVATMQLTNVTILEGDAVAMPLTSESFDLITSNLGINNFEDPQKALRECYRVLKPGGKIIITTNLTGTFREFFDCFAQLLEELNWSKEKRMLQEHIDHRGSPESVRVLFESAGFSLTRAIADQTSMRFANGTSFFNHFLIILGFLEPWKNIIEEERRVYFFEQLEGRLNELAAGKGVLELSVPMWYAEFGK